MDKKVKTKNIRQSVVFDAEPKEVYELIMDSKKHVAFSEGAAKISRKVGGNFTAYDGWITGKNIRIAPNKLIVQKWRGDDWPKGHYSIVTFKFIKKGKGTKLEFTQKGVPSDKYKDITSGWKEHYWEKMKNYLKE
ncbi:MAG: SRPBCC family protein [Candidatus Micrarchaeaceae archaeon]|jgi:activator of HSP90 ATPase